MRTLIAVASLTVLAAACGQNPAPSTSDPGVTPGDGATPASGSATSPDPTPAGPGSDPAAPASETPTTAPDGEQGGTADWRQVATAADASALGRLDQAWRLGRAEAEDHGFATQVEALGNLVDPNAGLAGRLQPTPGSYRCRTIKLGTRSEGVGVPYLEYPWFRCSVDLSPGGDLVLTKGTGSQRSRGLLYPDTDRRLVFLGAQAWGTETAYPRYGQTRERDQIGVFERIGADHYRLVIPWPKQESKLDILELRR